MADASDYLAQLQALLPTGAAWPRDPEATLTRLLGAFADGLAGVDARARNLLEEADPRTTLELLSDWEATTGLPDPCAGPAPSVEARRRELVAKVTGLGGQSIAYFTALAATLGYRVTISEYAPSVAGASRAGDPCNADTWAFVWRVNAAAVTAEFATAGQSVAGDPLADWGNGVLECAINRYKPAHTLALFAYGG